MGGLGAKNPKLSAMHLIWAVPGPAAKEVDGGIWWGGRDKVVVVVGLVCIWEVGRAMELKNLKLSTMYSFSTVPGPMVKESDGRMWWAGRDKVVVVAGCLDRMCEAAMHSVLAVPGLTAKERMREYGGVAGIWSWLWWAALFAHVKWGRGLGAKNPKTERGGSVASVPGQTAV